MDFFQIALGFAPMDVLDVLIVGGGPAGSTCARFLARAGARVGVVLDGTEWWLGRPGKQRGHA